MVRVLSRSFDVYWNDKLAIPVETLPLGKPSAADLAGLSREALAAHKERMATSDYVRALPTRDVLGGRAVGREAARLGEGDARLRSARQGAGRSATDRSRGG